MLAQASGALAAISDGAARELLPLGDLGCEGREEALLDAKG